MTSFPATIDFPLPDLQLVFVEGGEFQMGDERGDLHDACRPVHPVKLSSFYIGKFPVTQGLWQALMRNNPSRFQGERRPVERVSWEDAQDFIRRINSQKDVSNILHDLGLSIATFRLPTEAEWEYAARGGRYSQGYEYAGSDKLKQVGWYAENSGGQTREVGLLLGNELGIHDMSGNVYEWCADWFDDKYYGACQKQGTVENPQGPEAGVDRVVRGGSYLLYPVDCRPAGRRRGTPDLRLDYLGFRLVLSL